MSAVKSTVWTEPSEVPTPKPDEVHVWRISLAGQPGETARLKELLSPEELDHAGHFHFAHHQRRFIIRRAVLRQLLAACLGGSPGAVQWEFGSHGKPVVPDQTDDRDLRFSCSHSDDWALIALARGRELGVDLEQHRPMPDAAEVANRFFAPAEIRELTSLPPALKAAGFFNCWARKEAFIKALGLGLSYPLNRFVVSLAPEKPAALLAVEDDPEAVKKWRLMTFTAIPACSAALVFEGPAAALKYFDWKPRFQA
jgi:4'-phosphopantetheinyl transferase